MAREFPEKEDPQVASLKRRIGQLEGANEKLSNEVIDLKGRNQKLSARTDHLSSVIGGIESSKIWKITRPLVSLLSSAKRLVKKPSTLSPLPEKIDLEVAVEERYATLRQTIWPAKDRLEEQKEFSVWLATGPRFTTLVLVDKDSLPLLGDTLDSLLAQSNQTSSIFILRSNGFSGDVPANQLRPGIKLLPPETTLSEAIASLSEEYSVVVEAGLVLWPNALYEVAIAILKQPAAVFFYGDEDAINSGTQAHGFPRLRPAWSPAYLRSTNYIGNLGFYSTNLLKEICYQTKFGRTSGVYDLHLALLRHLEIDGSISPYLNAAEKISHIPRFLATLKERVKGSDKESLCFDLRARGVQATIEEILPGLFRTREASEQTDLVSIIIPTKDQPSFIRRCVESILLKTTYPHFEILILDTGSTDREVLNFYKEVGENPKIRLLNWAEQFNFSSVCNFGAVHAKGRFFLFLNNDTEVITADWIESMLEYCLRPEVGSVGAKLLYPDGTLQHVGVVAGVLGIAGHYLSGEADRPGLSFPTKYTKDAPREVSCCTAACLMVRRDVFEKSGGFDEAYRITFNDVDFALRLMYDLGLYNVYTPFAVLTHYESVSVGPTGGPVRGPQEFQMECDRMISRWGSVLTSDPFYHPLIDLGSNTPNIRL